MSHTNPSEFKLIDNNLCALGDPMFLSLTTDILKNDTYSNKYNCNFNGLDRDLAMTINEVLNNLKPLGKVRVNYEISKRLNNKLIELYNLIITTEERAERSKIYDTLGEQLASFSIILDQYVNTVFQ